jgi:hypothetical protein
MNMANLNTTPASLPLSEWYANRVAKYGDPRGMSGTTRAEAQRLLELAFTRYYGSGHLDLLRRWQTYKPRAIVVSGPPGISMSAATHRQFADIARGANIVEYTEAQFHSAAVGKVFDLDE